MKSVYSTLASLNNLLQHIALIKVRWFLTSGQVWALIYVRAQYSIRCCHFIFHKTTLTYTGWTTKKCLLWELHKMINGQKNYYEISIIWLTDDTSKFNLLCQTHTILCWLNTLKSAAISLQYNSGSRDFKLAACCTWTYHTKQRIFKNLH